MKMEYQLAKLMLYGTKRWCILLSSGDGWLKVVSDFALDKEQVARETFQKIRQTEVELFPDNRTTFHHPV